MPGRKGNGDLVLLARTEGWEVITFRAMGRMFEHSARNEDRLYPDGDGAEMLMKYLWASYAVGQDAANKE